MFLINFETNINEVYAAFLQLINKLKNMPSNLNALIRYKQIDKCLRNKFVKCTIMRMQEMCSEQLAEYRGIYKLISERSIREDIKTMRGSSLGFNAPIVVKDGMYSYSDESYSIFKSSIDDIELLKKVMLLLLGERENITNPRLKGVLVELSDKTGIEYIDEVIKENRSLSRDLQKDKSEINEHMNASINCYNENFAPSSTFDFMFEESEQEKSLFSWSDILDVL